MVFDSVGCLLSCSKNLVLADKLLLADYNSAFPSGMNAAATWSYDLINARGHAMGKEHRGKGIDVQLGPVAGMPVVHT